MSEFLILPILDGDFSSENCLQHLVEFNLWAETLTDYIEKSNIQQKVLAEQINVSPSTINMWCKGSRLPDGQMIYLLKSALQLQEEQDQFFMTTWLWTKRIRDIVPMLKSAIQNDDFEYARKIIAAI